MLFEYEKDRFITLEDNTILDTNTGYHWYAHFNDTTLWHHFVDVIIKLGPDWTIPTIKELQTVYDMQKCSLAKEFGFDKYVYIFSNGQNIISEEDNMFRTSHGEGVRFHSWNYHKTRGVAICKKRNVNQPRILMTTETYEIYILHTSAIPAYSAWLYYLDSRWLGYMIPKQHHVKYIKNHDQGLILRYISDYLYVDELRFWAYDDYFNIYVSSHVVTESKPIGWKTYYEADTAYVILIRNLG